MKNLKYIICLFTLTLFFSCGEDDVDSITNDGVFTETQHIFVGFTDTNTNAVVQENGGTVTYTVSMNEAINSDATVILQMESSDDSVEATFESNVTIPAGQTSTDITVTFNDDGNEDDGLEVYTLTIVDVQYTSTNTVYMTLNNAATSRSVDVLDLFETTVGDVTITFTWTNSSRDMDLFLVEGFQDLSGTIIDSSTGTTTTEIVIFPSTAPENADFSVFTQEWPAFSGGPVDYTITLDFPDGQQRVYDGTITQNSWILGLNKITIGSTVAYSISQF